MNKYILFIHFKNSTFRSQAAYDKKEAIDLGEYVEKNFPYTRVEVKNVKEVLEEELVKFYENNKETNNDNIQ